MICTLRSVFVPSKHGCYDDRSNKPGIGLNIWQSGVNLTVKFEQQNLCGYIHAVKYEKVFKKQNLVDI